MTGSEDGPGLMSKERKTGIETKKRFSFSVNIFQVIPVFDDGLFHIG